MSEDIARMKELTQIAGMAFHAAQAEMAILSQREKDLRRNLSQLTESKSQLAQKERRSDDPALVAGADIRWHRWVDRRRATINSELAQVLASIDQCRLKLRRAYGKDQAAQALLERAVLAKQARNRRSYES